MADPMKWPYSVECDGKQYPDYANCVAISTAGAQREMVVPSLDGRGGPDSLWGWCWAWRARWACSPGRW